MKLSIVIPTFNVAATLEACLRSVIGQSWTEFEILLIDGGSRDGTLAIVEKYRPALTVVVSEPDEGVFHAMMKGVRLARGEWIYFIGGDDTLYDEHVLRDMFSVDTTPFDAIYGDALWGGALYRERFDRFKIGRMPICHQTLFMRLELLRRMGGFDLRYPLNSDWELTIRMFGDPRIRWHYVRRIVARYANTGISSAPDHLFQSVRRRLIREHLRHPIVPYLLLGLRFHLFKKRRWGWPHDPLGLGGG